MANENGLISESLVSFASFFDGTLARTSRIEYNYFDGENRSEEDTLLNTVMAYIYQGPVEVPNYITTYYYSPQEITSSHQYIDDSILTVYPNPAKQVIRLKGDFPANLQYRWIALDGRLLSSGIVTRQITTPMTQNLQMVILQLFDQKQMVQAIPVLLGY